MKTSKSILLIMIAVVVQLHAYSQEVFKPQSERETKVINVLLPFASEKQDVTVEIVDNMLIFEGDIVLGTLEELENGNLKGAGITGKDRHWRGAIVPYVIASGHPKKSTILNAINHLNSKTNVRLIPRTTQGDYVEFINGSGCWSYVGRQGGKQQISIGGCSWGSTVHEICHAIGLWHEHSRADRDSYVTINYENITSGKAHNFNKYSVGIDLDPYDYGSIMHYGPKAFSKNGKATIVSKIAGKTFGQRTKLSNSDIRSVNAMLYPDVWHDAFCYYSELPRVGDFNGDGKDDVVTFNRGSKADAFVALSNGKRFNGKGWKWHDSFCYYSELPLTGDFNGDGRDDIVTFTRGTSADVFVALSNGYKFNGTGVKWHNSFCYNKEIPLTGDFNGDGKDDIATFTRGTSADVFVALSNGYKFNGNGWKWHNSFCYNSELPLVGDFNGDGKDDIATFTRGKTADVFVALSTGSSFVGTAKKWHNSFCYNYEIPVVADLNKDGRDDIVTFNRGSYGDVFVAFSTGSSFVGTGVKWYDWFANGSQIPLSGDFNGDGYDDLVSFIRSNIADVYVALTGKGKPGQSNQNNDSFTARADDSEAMSDVHAFNETNIEVFPNPASDEITIAVSAMADAVTSIKWFNVQGQMVQYNRFNIAEGSNQLHINVQELNNGLYYLEINQNGQVYREKVLINK